MRIVGLDGGSRRVGIAMSDELGLTAQPLVTIARSDDTTFLDSLRKALREVTPTLFVVGLPLRLDGTEGGAARKARKLAALVGTSFGVEVELWDERFTSIQAERTLIEAGLSRSARKGPTDRVAAAIMLQSFLDANRERLSRSDQ